MLTADVCVDRPVWALDRPFTYAVPERFADRVRVGTLLRFDLRGRRTRGWAVGLEERSDPGDLQEIVGISGRAPVFDEPLLAMARRLARIYVQPLAGFLALFTPERLGRPGDPPPPKGRGRGERSILWRIGPTDDPVERYRSEIEGALSRGLSATVAAPQVGEGSRVLNALAAAFGSDAAVVHSRQDPADRARALWSLALGERRVALGGRAAIFTPPMGPGLVVVHMEHDESLKEQRAPYYNGREAAVARAEECGGRALIASPTPLLRSWGSAEASAEWEVEQPDRADERSAWPVVEVVPRPRSGLPRRVIAAVLEAHRKGGRTLILMPRVEATAAGPGSDEVVAWLRRVAPETSVTRADRPALGDPGALTAALEGDVIVATQAALQEVERPRITSAVALGVDFMLRRPRGGSNEEVFTWLWTLARMVAGRPPGGRLVIEAEDAGNHVVQAVIRGDYHYFASKEMEIRREGLWPPFTRLVRLHVGGAPAMGDLIEQLSELPGTSILGPVEGRLGSEFLLKVARLEEVVDPLRSLVSGSRARILVEVDPRGW